MGNGMSQFKFLLPIFVFKFNNKLEPNNKCKSTQSEDDFIL